MRFNKWDIWVPPYIITRFLRNDQIKEDRTRIIEFIKSNDIEIDDDEKLFTEWRKEIINENEEPYFKKRYLNKWVDKWLTMLYNKNMIDIKYVRHGKRIDGVYRVNLKIRNDRLRKTDLSILESHRPQIIENFNWSIDDIKNEDYGTLYVRKYISSEIRNELEKPILTIQSILNNQKKSIKKRKSHYKKEAILIYL